MCGPTHSPSANITQLYQRSFCLTQNSDGVGKRRLLAFRNQKWVILDFFRQCHGRSVFFRSLIKVHTVLDFHKIYPTLITKLKPNPFTFASAQK